MPLTVTHNAPTESSYIPVAEFQSTTPESFTTSVLHSLHRNCRIAVSSKQAALIPALRAASTETTEPSASEENITIEGLEIWVTSENMIIWNPTTSTGTEIPYLSLTLHALQGNGVFMLFSLNPHSAQLTNPDDHDEDEAVEITVYPNAASSDPEIANALFKALSDCQSLHPDPEQSDSEDDGDPILFEGDEEMRLEGFPAGAGGWITAENVDQFRFEDAEEDGTILGPGAGAVRRRNEEEGGEDAAEVEGDTKWRRTG
ncbi:hypothetical protein EX30DRAFT_362211 [Ascodesmis nigricans]|uniref:Regulator of volume decrease after cellular swelling-domain-containing protein n=1 Tax=Ascodesmis nigricans TaxID=341454 RepID=A0A4S2N5G3_9PEZI|nr:hypothetical protein EX30DRAFT_362211 [Ascodesmis nigricans]